MRVCIKERGKGSSYARAAMALKRKRNKMVFVTVGTTCFDSLVKATTSTEFRKLLLDQGFSKLTIQIGRGKFEPNEEDGSGASLSWYRYKDSLAPDMKEADLIISHGGSGSIMESLALGKPLVVVVNDELMGNHQTELAKELHAQGHLLYTTPHGIHEVVMELPGKQWTPYIPGQPSLLAQELDAIMGFS